MKLFSRKPKKAVPVSPEHKVTKWVFSFVAAKGYLGKDSTYGELEDALMFDTKPKMYDYWTILREYHPESVLFHYMNPYRIAEVEISIRVVKEMYY